MKKTFCVFLAMLMLTGLCACGNSSTPGDGSSAPAETAAQEAADVEYSILVTDTESNPIPGVTLQFCDDTACRTGETDVTGSAVFQAKEGTYTVHVLKAPEGVIGTEEEFAFQGADRELLVTLEIEKPVLDRPYIGFAYYNPAKYRDTSGDLNWEVSQAAENIYILSLTYSTEIGADALEAMGMSEYAGFGLYASEKLYELICVQTDEAEAEAYLKDNVKPGNGWDSVTIEKVGSAENLTCFLVEQERAEMTEEYQSYFGENYDEYVDLAGDKETFLSGIRLQKPVERTLLFDTSDLDGNDVNIADVYAGHKVTMVNVWATWCDPCVDELPRLEKLSKEFESKDCQIIGICMDSFKGSDNSRAKEILEQAGVTYLNLTAPENGEEIFAMQYFPTSFFVDSSGKVLTKPYEGAPPAAYMYLYSNELDAALSSLEE